jgi:hypothetical protein
MNTKLILAFVLIVLLIAAVWLIYRSKVKKEGFSREFMMENDASPAWMPPMSGSPEDYAKARMEQDKDGMGTPRVSSTTIEGLN